MIMTRDQRAMLNTIVREPDAQKQIEELLHDAVRWRALQRMPGIQLRRLHSGEADSITIQFSETTVGGLSNEPLHRKSTLGLLTVMVDKLLAKENKA